MDLNSFHGLSHCSAVFFFCMKIINMQGIGMEHFSESLKIKFNFLCLMKCSVAFVTEIFLSQS